MMSLPTSKPDSPSPSRPQRWWTDKRVMGLIGLYVACAIFVAIGVRLFDDMVIQAGETEVKQQGYAAEVKTAWENGDTDTRSVLRVPRFGETWEYVVNEGVTNSDIRYGPGRDTETARAGEVGNMVIAAHRNGAGSPFNDIERLEPCDEVVVQTATREYTYRVIPYSDDREGRTREASRCFDASQVEELTTSTYAEVSGKRVVTPTDGTVTWPVPISDPYAEMPEPTQRLVTLYTCYPEFSNEKRIAVTAMLTRTEIVSPHQG